MNPSDSIRLRIRVGPRDPQRFPREDDALGQALESMVDHALQQGVPPPALLAFREDKVELIDLVPIIKAGERLDYFIAGVAGRQNTEALAFIGVLSLLHTGRPRGKAGVVFIEWPDNRWWHTFRPLDADMSPLQGVPRIVHRAVDGMPRPGGLGGWFSRSRYLRIKIQLRPIEPPESEPVVH